MLSNLPIVRIHPGALCLQAIRENYKDSMSALALQLLLRRYLRSTSSRHVAQLVFNSVLGCNRGRVTAADDDNLAVLSCVDGSIEHGFGSICKSLEFKHSRRANISTVSREPSGSTSSSSHSPVP